MCRSGSTLQGNKLVDVQALQLPSDRSRSQRISQEAGPLLRSEALKAQSPNIDIVSGASYTSEGYAAIVAGSPRRRERVTPTGGRPIAVCTSSGSGARPSPSIYATGPSWTSSIEWWPGSGASTTCSRHGDPTARSADSGAVSCHCGK